MDLTSALGKSRVVSSHHDIGSGYYCDVCDCVLKDSTSYLDHINGKEEEEEVGEGEEGEGGWWLEQLGRDIFQEQQTMDQMVKPAVIF